MHTTRHPLRDALQRRPAAVPSAGGVPVAQAWCDALAASPRMVAQRERLQTLQRPVVQRDVEPGDTDPLTDMLQPGSKSLLYGNSMARKYTSLRGTLRHNTEWAKEYRTIDAYNDAIGLSKLMGGGDPCNLYRVRRGLASDVDGWGQHVAPEEPAYANHPDLRAWVSAMQQRAPYIGLVDLGDDSTPKAASKSLKRVKGKRYKKNFNSRKAYGERQAVLTPAYLHAWLAPGRTVDQGDQDKQQLGTTARAELNAWIRKAFWRRTSKLGIDFTTGRGATIHMNTAADPSFDPAKAKPLKLKAGGMSKMKESHGRMITTSEYRHVKRQIKRGRIDPARVNFYNELA